MSPRTNGRGLALLPGLAAIALVAFTTGAWAQVTAEQQSAIKASCRNDFMAKCSGITPGGKEALECLQKNVAGLSGSCKSAVSATLPPPAPAASQPVRAANAAPTTAPAAAPTPAATAAVAAPAAGPTPEQLNAIKFTCRADFKRHCVGIQPGGPEAMACLQRNATQLTPNCKTSLAAIAETMPAAATTTTTTTTTVTTAAAPPPHRLPAVTPAGRVLRRVIEHNR